jgi:hypothetical protein
MFTDLVYQMIIKIKDIPHRRLMRRKSCDILMFGGKTSIKKDLKIEVDKPYDILYKEFVTKEANILGKTRVDGLMLPWYLLKTGLDQRMNSLRILV